MTSTTQEMAEKAESENRFTDSFNLYLQAARESYDEMVSKKEYKAIMNRLTELRAEHDAFHAKAMEVLKRKGEFQTKVINSRPLGNLIANKQYIEAACCEEFRDALTSEPENYEIIKSDGGYVISVFHMNGDYYTTSERCPFCEAFIHMKETMGD